MKTKTGTKTASKGKLVFQPQIGTSRGSVIQRNSVEDGTGIGYGNGDTAPTHCKCPDDSGSCEYCMTVHYAQPDIDICSECGEHTEFNESESECCGAGAYDTDPDIDMER